jgi:putative thioredoxin
MPQQQVPDGAIQLTGFDVEPAGRGAAAVSDGHLIKDTTLQDFRQDVMVESMTQPVLVDFWAPWCGPCKQLTPVIEKVVRAAKGKVKLVKMNIDEYPQIAGQLGVQSIPAVFAFDKGQPVDGFMGALPESQIQAFIEKLTGPIGPGEVEQLLEAANVAAEAGDVTQASELFAAVLSLDAANLGAIAGLARLRLDMGDLDGARGFLALVPDSKADDPAIAGVRAAITLAEQAASLGDTSELEARVAANPADHQARFDLAVALSGANDRVAATDHLIAIIKADRKWNDEAARKQLLQLFDAWGPSDETSEGRRKLSAVLFA